MKRPDWRSLVIACCLAVLAAAPVLNVRASVQLSEITATALADGTIKIRWVTATELNTAAFQLYRSLSATTPWGQWTAIGAQIGARGDGISPTTYEFIDNNSLTPGTTYYYLLEELETDGVTRRQYTDTAFIPSATAMTPGGPTFTPTSTATRTATPTLTVAPTDTPGDPPTATRQFTNTPVVGPPQPTATLAPSQPTATAAAASPTSILTARLATPTGQAGVIPATPLPTATRLATATAAATTAAPTATRAAATTVTPTFTPSVTASPAVFAAKGTAEPVLRETPVHTGSSGTPAEGAQRNEGWALVAGGIAVALAAALGAVAIILWRRRQS